MVKKRVFLFSTRSVKYLSAKMDLAKGHCESKNFSDGEIYVKVESEVKNFLSWVLASTPPPADNLLETLFLLDALQRERASSRLLLTYFGYARQDRAERGESFSGKLVCDWIAALVKSPVFIVHMHSKRLAEFLPYKNRVPYELICSLTQNIDAIAAPDKGAAELAAEIGKRCGAETIYIEKIRPVQEKVVSKDLVGNVRGKRVLIVDDMISTGGTLIQAAKLLKKAGAKTVAAYATHGIFSRDAIDKIGKSPLSCLYVTNSLQQRAKGIKKVKVLDLSYFLKQIILTESKSRTGEERG